MNDCRIATCFCQNTTQNDNFITNQHNKNNQHIHTSSTHFIHSACSTTLSLLIQHHCLRPAEAAVYFTHFSPLFWVFEPDPQQRDSKFRSSPKSAHLPGGKHSEKVSSSWADTNGKEADDELCERVRERETDGQLVQYNQSQRQLENLERTGFDTSWREIRPFQF